MNKLIRKKFVIKGPHASVPRYYALGGAVAPHTGYKKVYQGEKNPYCIFQTEDTKHQTFQNFPTTLTNNKSLSNIGFFF